MRGKTKHEVERLRGRRECGNLVTPDGLPVMRRIRPDEVPVGYRVCGNCTGSGAYYNVHKHRHAYCPICDGTGLAPVMQPDLFYGKDKESPQT